ncbi:MAG: peptidase [Bacteroidetes bacterium]|nr:MAG: peptidase [Bacteroidota bacterium]
MRPELRMLPLDGEALPVNGLANNSVIHLRRGESSKTELVTQGRLGAPLCILLERGGKSLVRIPDGYLGWVNTPEIVSLTAEGLEEYRMADKLVFKAQTGFSYSRADEDARPVSDLIAGNILVNEGREGGFYKVVYPDGRKAYVKAEEAMPASEFFHQEPTSTGLLETALRFHGIPYLWGGSSAKAIDCSGLSAVVFFLNGILLPRDADLQALCGREISTEWSAEGLEAGDLLFFGRKATADKPERATHVAIYIGGGEFIHSSGYRERVSINHMDSTQAHFIPGYPEIFVRATRIVGEEGGAFGPIVENEMYKTIVKNRE